MTGVIDGFFSDVKAEYERVSLLALVKAILNPSIHACVLARCAAATTGLLHVFFRNLLIFKHSIDVASGAKIGRSLRLPHPFSIVLGRGVVLGDGVVIYQGVTLGNKAGYPSIGDGVVIYPNSVIVGSISVGVCAIVGAGVFLNKDLPHGCIYKG